MSRVVWGPFRVLALRRAAASASASQRVALRGSPGPLRLPPRLAWVPACTALPRRSLPCAVLACAVLGCAARSAVLGEVQARAEAGVREFLAELGQDPPDSLASRVAGGEELNPDPRGVDMRPDRQRPDVLGADFEGHDVLAVGCAGQREERFGELRLEGRSGLGRGRGGLWRC